MRQIDVDLDVFSAIWANRLPLETSENDVLRRILLEWRDPSTSEQPPSPTLPASPTSSVGAEVKTSKLQPKPETREESAMGKIRWVDDIEAALRTLGGRASLHSIYKAVEVRRREGGRSVPKTIDAVIRRTLEDHSSDSANFRGADIFALVGRGEWALR